MEGSYGSNGWTGSYTIGGTTYTGTVSVSHTYRGALENGQSTYTKSNMQDCLVPGAAGTVTGSSTLTDTTGPVTGTVTCTFTSGEYRRGPATAPSFYSPDPATWRVSLYGSCSVNGGTANPITEVRYGELYNCNGGLSGPPTSCDSQNDTSDAPWYSGTAGSAGGGASMKDGFWSYTMGICPGLVTCYPSGGGPPVAVPACASIVPAPPDVPSPAVTVPTIPDSPPRPHVAPACNTPTNSIAYVAFGDSLTTGYSIPDCESDPKDLDYGKNGCTGNSGVPTVVPYPERVRSALGLSALNRVGIWGYTADQAKKDAARGTNAKGDWEPQYLAVDRASTLVTGALGINDMHFSQVHHWYYHCAVSWAQCKQHADADIASVKVDGALDVMFSHLKTAAAPPPVGRGAKVIIPNYYNPYADNIDCFITHGIADVVVDTLNAKLAAKAAGTGIVIADAHAKFVGHGAGSSSPHVFGDTCSDTDGFARGVASLVGSFFGAGDAGGLKRHHDPHPNNYGAQDIADAIVAAY